MNSFYVYVHRRATDGRIFYVGKGRGRRAHAVGRNPHWHNIVKKHGHTVHFVDQGLDEATAFELEQFMIAFCGRDTLCNMTDGGEGTSGWVPSVVTRARIGAKSVGRFFSPETRLKISVGNKGKVLSDETKRKLSLAAIGRDIGPIGRAKISAASTGRKKSVEDCAHHSETMKGNQLAKGNVMSAKVREKMKLAHVGRKVSPEVKARMSESAKARWALPESQARRELVGAVRRGKSMSLEQKEKLRVAAHAQFADPDARAKHQASVDARVARQRLQKPKWPIPGRETRQITMRGAL